MKLYIDTSNREKTIVRLGEVELSKNSQILHSQVVLPMIEELLKKGNKKITDITEIEVFVGPGSFTGLRVGVSIANALGYALKIPVNGKKVYPESCRGAWELEIVEPTYE